MKKLAIFGSGGHARVVLDTLSTNKENIFDDVNFFCNFSERSTIKGIDVYKHTSNEVLFSRKITHYILGVGDIEIRKKILSLLEDTHLIPVNIIHVSAIISSSSNLGKGLYIGANCIVNCDSHISDHSVINTASIIEHDCSIERLSFIGPNSTLLGGSTVGVSSFIGAGTIIGPKIGIGSNCVIGAGSTVLKEIPNNSFALGTPCKVIRKRL